MAASHPVVAEQKVSQDDTCIRFQPLAGGWDSPYARVALSVPSSPRSPVSPSHSGPGHAHTYSLMSPFLDTYEEPRRDAFEMALHGLEETQSVKHTLTGFKPQPNQWVQLWAAIAKHSFIEELVLSGLSLGDDALTGLFAALRKTTTLTSLSIEDNAITEHRMETLIAFLCQHDKLSKLRLWNDRISADSGRRLVKCLAESSLRVLDLSCNALDSSFTASLATALQNPGCSLEFLDVGSNRLGASGAVHLSMALKGNRTLTSLKAYWNDMRDDGVYALLSSAQAHPTLKSLDVRWNGTTEDGIVQMGQYLRDHADAARTSLEVLFMGGNATKSMVATRKLVDSQLSTGTVEEKDEKLSQPETDVDDLSSVRSPSQGGMPVDLHAAIEKWALNGSVLRTVLGPDAPYPISLDSTPVTGHLLHGGGALESVTLAEILADHRVRVVYQDAHRSRVLDDAQVLFKANELPAVFAAILPVVHQHHHEEVAMLRQEFSSMRSQAQALESSLAAAKAQRGARQQEDDEQKRSLRGGGPPPSPVRSRRSSEFSFGSADTNGSLPSRSVHDAGDVGVGGCSLCPCAKFVPNRFRKTLCQDCSHNRHHHG